MKYKSSFDLFIFILVSLCFFGFFLVFTQMFSGELEKIVVQVVLSKSAFTANIKSSIAGFIENEKNNLEISTQSIYVAKISKTDFKGNVLFSENENKKMPIASLTKLMSAIIVLENYDLSEKIKTMDPNEEFFVADLLQVFLIESNNLAAVAISEKIGTEKFVVLMNKKAKEIGMENTKFFNETGLDFKDTESNYSTAKDLIKLSEYILENYPLIFDITKQADLLLCDIKNELCRKVENTNELLKTNFKGYKIIGGKTGETKIAGGCLLLVLESENLENYLISIILNSEDRFGDTKKIINEYGNK